MSTSDVWPATKIVARFEIPYLQFLDVAGRKTQTLPEPYESDPMAAVELYRNIMLCRAIDARAIVLKRTGLIGTYASSMGQEAVSLGAALAMRDIDCLCPSYRDAPGQFRRGVKPRTTLLFWGGHPLGNVFQYGPSVHDLLNQVPVASQCYLAAGIAIGNKLLGKDGVVVCILGDGATSNAAFTGPLNWAAVMKASVVYVINNNQWAISCPLAEQTAAETLAQKAILAGVPGIQVDGNDVFAMKHAVGMMLERARAGHGPGVAEAITFRITDHTTVDDATRYRDDADVAAAARQEPMIRLRNFLCTYGSWNDEKESALKAEIAALVEQEEKAYLSATPAGVEALFDHVYADLPPHLAEQLEEARCYGGAS